MTADSQIAELASLVRDQMREIDRLRTVAVQAERARAENVRLKDEIDALIAWIGGDGDALACLQQIYANPRTTEASKIRAASAALPFEKAKPAATVNNVVTRSLFDTLEWYRLRDLEQREQAKTIEGRVVEPAGTVLGGEGSDPAA
jgi:hypothetical protein